MLRKYCVEYFSGTSPCEWSKVRWVVVRPSSAVVIAVRSIPMVWWASSTDVFPILSQIERFKYFLFLLVHMLSNVTGSVTTSLTEWEQVQC